MVDIRERDFIWNDDAVVVVNDRNAVGDLSEVMRNGINTTHQVRIREREKESTARCRES